MALNPISKCSLEWEHYQYIIGQLTNQDFKQNIQKKLTGKIIEQYKKEFPSNRNKIEIFERVNLMTAENLHVNSFMYEPLMDLSEDHLKRLYSDVSAL